MPYIYTGLYIGMRIEPMTFRGVDPGTFLVDPRGEVMIMGKTRSESCIGWRSGLLGTCFNYWLSYMLSSCGTSLLLLSDAVILTTMSHCSSLGPIVDLGQVI